VGLPAILDQGINCFVFRQEAGDWKIAELIFEQHKLADYLGAPESLYRAMSQTAIERVKDRGRA
jgi:hypothetical protein